MARSLQATEKFRLQLVYNKNAQGEESVRMPGYLACSRRYTGGGQDAANGDWIQLVPGYLFGRDADRAASRKGDRSMHAQWEGVDLLPQKNALFRIDYKG